jgi:hypothetical protein
MSVLHPEEPDRASDYPSRGTSMAVLTFGWLVDPLVHLWILEGKFAARFGGNVRRLQGLWQGLRNIGRLGGRIG